MAKKKFLGIFDKRPLIWFHYILLTFVLFGAFFLANYFFLNNMFDLNIISWIGLFIWYFIFISIGDQIIHAILGVD